MFNRFAIGLVVGAALVIACAGDISNDLSQRPDRGGAPDQDLAVVFRAIDGWRSVVASTPAFDALEFGVMARAEVANIDAWKALAERHQRELQREVSR